MAENCATSRDNHVLTIRDAIKLNFLVVLLEMS